MSEPNHTPGFVRFMKWDAEEGEAQIRFGLSSPDSDEWTFSSWMGFRNEADAMEFVKRWNCHETLLAASKKALEACQENIAYAAYKNEHILLEAINVLRPAIKAAESIAGEG